MTGLKPLFLGLFATFAFSWLGLALIPNMQIGHLDPQSDEEGTDVYPLPLSGMAERGRKVYTANGCFYCHTQQIRPDYDSSDIDRKWGERRSAPRDYIFARPVLLGRMRMGPDLSNLGKRAPADDQAGPATAAVRVHHPLPQRALRHARQLRRLLQPRNRVRLHQLHRRLEFPHPRALRRRLLRILPRTHRRLAPLRHRSPPPHRLPRPLLTRPALHLRKRLRPDHLKAHRSIPRRMRVADYPTTLRHGTTRTSTLRVTSIAIRPCRPIVFCTKNVGSQVSVRPMRSS